VPTLVMGGDLDNVVPLEQTRMIADLFPASQLVEVAGAAHGAAFEGCATEIASGFVETLLLGDTSCTRSPARVFPAVGEFPLRAREAAPAAIDRGEGNEAGRLARRVAGVAAATVKDALTRVQLAFFGPGKVASRGLRGGDVTFRFRGANGLNWKIDLDRARFAEDVIVSGTVHWPPAGSVQAELDVSGAADGHLTVRTNAYLVSDMFVVRGVIDGERVAVVVPQL